MSLILWTVAGIFGLLAFVFGLFAYLTRNNPVPGITLLSRDERRARHEAPDADGDLVTRFRRFDGQ